MAVEEHRRWAKGERGQPVTVGPAREPQWEARPRSWIQPLLRLPVALG